MLKETRQWFCDACGEEIKGYKGRIEINTLYADNSEYETISESSGLDFCADCMASFNEWRKSRANRIQNTPFSDNNTKGEI